MEALPASRSVLLITLCLWTFSISTGETSASEASESLFEGARERVSADLVDPASQTIEPTVQPGENPGRRRRADARRRTHEPKKSPAEKANDERVAQEKALATVKKAREEAIEVAQRKEIVAEEQKKIRYDKAKARIEAAVRQVTEMHAKAEADMLEAKKSYLDRSQKEAENAKLADEETHTVHTTKILRSVIEEAEENVAEALKFCKAVNNGEGDDAYRKSFLAQEHREQGLGGPGGFARLTEEQFNIPWLVNLNKALSAAKLDTNFDNMVKVQKLLDTAEDNTEALERKWKSDEENRSRAEEALQKDAIKREKDAKREAKREAVQKKMEELATKENSRKAQLAALKAKTAMLKEQAAELEEKALEAAAYPPTPPPTANATEPTGELAEERAEELLDDAKHSESIAQKFKVKEQSSEEQARHEEEEARTLMHNAQPSKAHKLKHTK